MNVFGSYPAGLSTFLSDIDVSILGMGVEDPNSAELEELMCSVPESGDAEEATESNSTDEEEAEAVESTPWEIDYSRGKSEDAAQHVSWEEDRTAATTIVSESEESEAGADGDLGLSDSDSDSDGPRMFVRKRKRAQELEVDLSFNISAHAPEGEPMSSLRGRDSQRLKNNKDLENRKRQSALLQTLFTHLRAMDWMSEGEFRRKAKVPIIYLTHRSGVGCDVSLGVTAQDTSSLVSQLKAIDADAFVVVSSFLKVFLHLLALDKPFTGGSFYLN